MDTGTRWQRGYDTADKLAREARHTSSSSSSGLQNDKVKTREGIEQGFEKQCEAFQVEYKQDNRKRTHKTRELYSHKLEQGTVYYWEPIGRELHLHTLEQGTVYYWEPIGRESD